MKKPKYNLKEARNRFNERKWIEAWQNVFNDLKTEKSNPITNETPSPTRR